MNAKNSIGYIYLLLF